MPPTHSKRSPAFQFYPDSFFGSSKVNDMSMIERGCYITLLARCWQDAGLTTDLKRLAAMCKMKPAHFERLWGGLLGACFVERGGKFHNNRLDIEWKKQRENTQRAIDNAHKRWGKDKQRSNATKMPPHDSSNALSIAPAVEIETETRDLSVIPDPKKETAVQFHADVALRDLQAKYPENRVTAGYRTSSAFWDEVSAVNSPAESFATMLDNLENHKRSHEWRSGFVPALEKWLRDGLWRRRLSESPPAAESVSGAAKMPPWYKGGAKAAKS